MKRLILVVVVFFSIVLPAQALSIGKGGPGISYTSVNTAKVGYSATSGENAINRMFTNAPGGGVSLTDLMKKTVGGVAVDLAVKSVVPSSAYPVIAVAAAAAGGYAAGTALYDYFQDNGITYTNGVGFSKTVGGQTSTSIIYQSSYNGTFQKGTLAAADQELYLRYGAAMVGAGIYGTVTVTKEGCVPDGTQYYKCSYLATTTNYTEYVPYRVVIQVNKISDTWCFDGMGNLTIRPTGGLCPSGTLQPIPIGDVPPLLTTPPRNAPGLVSQGIGLGVPAPAGAPAVTGPATAPGPSKTGTTTGPAGTTTTNVAVTNNYTYQGDTITVNQTTVTTTTAPDGSTTTDTTTEDPPKEDVAPPQDANMPEVPKLYERKYPDGLAGVWATRKAQLQASPIFSFLASLVPSTGDGGCPSWSMPVMYGIGHMGTADVSVPCWVWSAVRGIIIVTALIASRRIIFGG